MTNMEKLMKYITDEVVNPVYNIRVGFVIGQALTELEIHGDSNISQICNDLKHIMVKDNVRITKYKSKMTIDELLDTMILSLNGEPARDRAMSKFQTGVLLQVMIDRLDDIDEDVMKRCIDIRDQLISKKEVKKYVYSN